MHQKISPCLDRWLATPAAHMLVEQESRQLAALLPRLVGYRLLQIGHWGYATSLLDAGGMLCRWVLTSAAGPGSHIVSDGENLPIASRCLDAVILPHSLELSANPHRLLREVERVLRDRGQLVLLGFNPLAPWVLWQSLGRRHARYPGSRLYPLRRVGDWLDLLDFEVVRSQRYSVGFPWLPREGIDLARAGWWRLPALAAPAYLVVARKRVVPATPVRLARRERAMASGMPEASARSAARRAA